ncbi:MULTISPECIES: menaquinone biosynthesis family protein [Helicobacter]|uniref:1,4-dihydroxy-6-naphtoate synthase n=1 Tax=Helicobacter typhlonius TaxID=76936 RepID=A0A099UE32_9HELI|nr:MULTISPECIES: MqnA/MqnD/SBP family protein [Helicobacter]TLD79193.1 S-ribosylhomocysteine lyase [Helicobacter typhlonius]TLD86121.1 S-ribosylhomocysteine lyase [Helicobacter sp. MIT 03-1616]CUU40531.1 Menaquinone via futalosine step 4 [Helicobacter typhlonius]
MISVAHSPDADDLFMYYAIVFGWVDSKKLCFNNTAKDIQTLNLATLKGEYDISAISFALYPLVAQNYALLRTGVSFGNGYGPKLIRKKDKILKKHFKVALSGEHTTNAMIFRIAYPDARIVYKNFLDIESAVLSGEVDAGVLIHESILNFNENLCVESELWDIWQNLSGGELPLPLGGMALRRSLPLTTAIECESMLTKAVQLGVQNKAILSQMLLERGIIRVNAKELDTYLSLYANADSISMSEIEIEAVDRLFELGFKAGFYPQILKARDYFIPSEYNDLRFC